MLWEAQNVARYSTLNSMYIYAYQREKPCHWTTRSGQPHLAYNLRLALLVELNYLGHKVFASQNF